jgi:DNA-binding LacI/PurR family transcriptional regulator
MSLGSRNSNQGLRTEQAKRMLVRYVWDLNLKTGDRVPSYQSLRSQLGLGDGTIARAVASLKEDGVLTTRNRTGTYVADPHAAGHYGRVVGLLALRPGGKEVGPFYSFLLHDLQSYFHSHGCRSEIFYRKPTTKDAVGLDYFHGLERSITNGLLDALVLTANVDQQSWQQLEKIKMHPCFVGALTHTPRGVFIDMVGAMRSMVLNLIDRGCRRPGLIGGSGDLHDLIWPQFCDILKDVGGADPNRLFFTIRNGIEGGRQSAAQILACNTPDRPDGIAILDDVTAMAFTSCLAREKSEYSPRFAVMTNKQIPLEYPFKDITFFEFDTSELVKRTGKLTMQYLIKGKSETEKILVSLRQIKGDALSVPTIIPEASQGASIQT